VMCPRLCRYAALWLCLQAASLSVGAAVPATLATPMAAARTDDERIRIQLVPRDQVDLSSEIAAKIASLPFRDGDSFSAGQTLVSLDCALYLAQLHKAQAEADAARELWQVDQRLAQLHSVGELEVQQADAKMKATAAEVVYVQTIVSKCSISAPFGGRVLKRTAAPQQFVEAGKTLLTIVDTSHLELKMIVPSKWLAELRRGQPLTVQIAEVGRAYPARIARIGARVDPITQTVDVTAALTGNAPELLPGMSGWATFAK
jgi:RND family efflux transporter MFP subunit